MSDKLLKFATIFANATEIRRKKDEQSEPSGELQVEAEIIEDLVTSMTGCIKSCEGHLPGLEKLIEGKDKNELISISVEELKSMRDFPGNLALLCNMILNGKEYSREDKKEAIEDETTE